LDNKLVNISLKNSFWLKIEQTFINNNGIILVYKIYQNGANIMEIKEKEYHKQKLTADAFIDQFNVRICNLILYTLFIILLYLISFIF